MVVPLAMAVQGRPLERRVWAPLEHGGLLLQGGHKPLHVTGSMLCVLGGCVQSLYNTVGEVEGFILLLLPSLPLAPDLLGATQGIR